MKYLFIILICAICLACTKETRLEYALKLAENNRIELERVLEYYSQEAKDSLKYKAACFLIENMVYHSHVKEEASIAIREYLAQGKSYGGEVLGNPDLKRYSDIKYVTSDFLIKNIEHSFKVWKDTPWGKYINFDQFCEDILPYKVGNEPLTLWKENYYGYYQPILDSLLTDDCPLKAAQIIYDAIDAEKWDFMQDMQLQLQVEANTLLKYRFGNCGEYAQFATYVMRALGIPGGIDIILQNPDDSYRFHYWNYVKDKDGKSKEFEIYTYRPQIEDFSIERKRGKIYRRTFGVQEESYAMNFSLDKLPSNLHSPLMKDVSNLYFPESSSIKIDFRDNKKVIDDILFLCVFNNKEWVPICAEPLNRDVIEFRHLEKEIVYLPAFFIKNKVVPAAAPIVLKDDYTQRIISSEEETEFVVLKRKFRTYSYHQFCIDRTIGAKFQVSDNINFSNPKTIYTISYTEGLNWNNIPKDSIIDHGQYRYVRYLGPEDSNCNIADLIFYTKDATRLTGKVIGTKGAWNDGTLTADKAFDGEPLTFFDAPTSFGSWTGLDLGDKYEITRIAYLPRNDDNHIREGDLYELFHWKDNWVSLGKQTGVDGNDLVYENVLKGSLLLLKNHTRGVQERIFTYEDGKQVWW